MEVKINKVYNCIKKTVGNLAGLLGFLLSALSCLIFYAFIIFIMVFQLVTCEPLASGECEWTTRGRYCG